MSIFSRFPTRKPKGNMFNLSHEKKLSFNMGHLVPVYVQDIIPGDRFRVNSEVFLRFSPMLTPPMHRYNVYVHFFFVPMRLIWENWESFITGGADGTETPTFPKTAITDGNKSNFTKGKLPDYMGLPITDGVTVTQQLDYSALPFRAYQSIYNEYYRDPNLTTIISFSTGSTTSAANDLTIRRRCWEKDYFTSALPWTQRGGDVNLPIEGEIDFIPDYTSVSNVYKSGGSPVATDGALTSQSGTLTDANSDNAQLQNLDSSTIYDLENVAITINDLRVSVRLQQWLEANARGGGRYIEQIFSHFGVLSSDARLQRPEYLGGGKSPVVMSEVLSTADSGSYDVGEMFGHGISVGKTNTFNKYFEEHGYVMGIISVMPRTAYQQGVPKHLLKYTDKYEWYFPQFANLGEQEVLNGELYHDWTDTVDKDETFGYQSRYAEYKYGLSTVHGDFKDNLDYWHHSRIFSSSPTLNTSFLECNPDTRIFIVDDDGATDHMWCQIYNNVKAWRRMPKYGVPLL